MRLNSAIAWNGAGQDAGLPGIRRVTWGVGETCTNCLVGWPKKGDVLYYRTAVLVITRNMKCNVCVKHQNTIGERSKMTGVT